MKNHSCSSPSKNTSVSDWEVLQTPRRCTTYDHNNGDGSYFKKVVPKKCTSTRSRRDAAGMKNPPHDSKTGKAVLASCANSPDKNLLSPTRTFRVRDPVTGRLKRKLVQGHKNIVMGHKPDQSASDFWNKTGHMQTRAENRKANKDPSMYHGVECKLDSAKSGSLAQQYISPRPSRGSHPQYWDQGHPDFNPNDPWPSYKKVSTPSPFKNDKSSQVSLPVIEPFDEKPSVKPKLPRKRTNQVDSSPPNHNYSLRSKGSNQRSVNNISATLKK